MALRDLIEKNRSSSTSALEESAGAPGVSLPPVEPGSGVPSTAGSSSAEEPWGVSQTETPSGIEIYFQAGPKRLYRLRAANWVDDAGFYGGNDEGWVDVPSMSDVLGILDKPGLPWWGMKVGVEGVLKLYWDGVIAGAPNPETMTDHIVELLTEHKLTVNHVRDRAGDRGTAIHDALEVWSKTGIIPDPKLYPEAERGYVEGLKNFIIDSGAMPVRSEVMVGSLAHRFAGRFDLLADLPDEARVFTHRTEKGRGDKQEPIEGGRWLLDLKTSKGVYVTHFLQLEGYDLALEESHGETTHHRGVVHVLPDGRYELVKSKKTRDDFLAVRRAYDAVGK